MPPCLERVDLNAASLFRESGYIMGVSVEAELQIQSGEMASLGWAQLRAHHLKSAGCYACAGSRTGGFLRRLPSTKVKNVPDATTASSGFASHCSPKFTNGTRVKRPLVASVLAGLDPAILLLKND